MKSKLVNSICDNYQRRKELLYEKGVFGYLRSGGGYILIIVMLISTLLISVSSEFLLNAQININYMKRFRDEARAQTIAEAGMNLAQMILKADSSGLSLPALSGTNSNKSIDTYNDIWAIDFPELELGAGSVQIKIQDEQSKINISAVSTKFVDRTPFYTMLERFFINMGFPADYAEAVLDWVDKDDVKAGSGAETYDYYSTLPTPYNAANTVFDSIDQLLLVKYFTPEIYYGYGGGNMLEEMEDESLVDTNASNESVTIMDIMDMAESGQTSESAAEANLDELKIGAERSRRLSTYLRAHGNADIFNANINKININTASYRVLMSLSDDMTEMGVENIIRKRIETPFTTVNGAKEYISDELVRKNLVTTKSDLFRITSTGYVNGNMVRIEAVFDRSKREYYYYSIR